jgi:hypothetical protein
MLRLQSQQPTVPLKPLAQRASDVEKPIKPKPPTSDEGEKSAINTDKKMNQR